MMIKISKITINSSTSVNFCREGLPVLSCKLYINVYLQRYFCFWDYLLQFQEQFVFLGNIFVTFSLLRMTNLPALAIQFLLNCLHVAHLPLTKIHSWDRVRDGILPLQYQDFSFWSVWYQNFEIVSSDRWHLWEKILVSL